MRPVSRRTRSSVDAGSASSSGSACAPRAGGRCRSSGACARGGRARAARRSSRCAPAGAPRRARGTRARSRRAASAAFSRRWTSSLLATTRRPEVSRSRRCTIPGRHGSPPAAPRAASASAERPAAVRTGGVHDHARRACRRPAGRRPRRRPRPRRAPWSPRRGGPAPSRTSIVSPPRRRSFLRAGAPSTRDPPGVDPPLRLRARAQPAPRGSVEALAGRLRRDEQRLHRGRGSRSARARRA